MKFILAFILLPTFCSSQSLDSVRTKSQAEQLIIEKFRYFGHKYDSFNIELDNIKFDNFKKGDFNNDGIEDLLVFGTAHITVKDETYEEDEIVILIGDKKRPRKVNFPNSFFRGLGIHIIPYPIVINFENQDFILIRYDLNSYKGELFKSSKPNYDTLFIEQDHVIPFNPIPSDKIVTRIEFRTDYCYGPCPVFEISINKNLKVKYNGIDHVVKTGEYKLRAQQKDWDYLFKLIKYLRVEDLRESYAVNWTDDQTAYLSVYFNDGTKKEIEDYGMTGTFGLSVLYDYFYELQKF